MEYIVKVKKMKNECDIIDNIKDAIDSIKEDITDFESYISLALEKNKVFIYTDIKRILASEVNLILCIFQEYNYDLEAISTKNKEFKDCMTFEISIN